MPKGSVPLPGPVDLALVFEKSPCSLLVLMPNLVIVAATEAYLSETMTVREEILGRHLFDVFPDNPDDLEATGVATLRASLERVLADREPDAMAVQKHDISRPSSRGGGFEERYWSPTNCPILTPDGNMAYIIHHVVELTGFVKLRQNAMSQQEAAEELRSRTVQMEQEILLRAQEIQRVNADLREREERFRLLSNVTSDVVWDWDLATGDAWFSEGFHRVLGTSSADPTIEAWRTHIHPDDLNRVRTTFDQHVAAAAGRWENEFRVIDASGNVKWLTVRYLTVKDASGRPTRVLGGATDLTVQRQADERLKEQAALLDLASDAILVRDLEGRITFWSAGAARLYGWTADDAIGQREPEFLSGDPDVFAAAQETVVTLGQWTGELRKHTRSGRDLLVEARWTLLRDEYDEPSGVLVINTDITERRRLEAQEARVQRLDSIGTLAGGIAHDLNNVLTPITASIELLRGDVTASRGLEMLDILETSARRGADMVAQVLAFSRGVDGRRVRVRPNEIVDEVVRLISDTFPRSIHIVTHPNPETSDIFGDPTQLHQVLLNLCVNARDAMPSGGILRISVDDVHIDEQYAATSVEATPGHFVLVEVTDSGTGIPRDAIDRVFEPFFTTKPIGDGTGLGLATTRAIVVGHGGFVTAYSEPGEGSTFKVYFPAAGSVNPMPDVIAPQSASSWRSANDETVLVVDDEAPVLYVSRETLESVGYKVLTAHDGAEAIALFATHQRDVDLVLTDIMMPIMDGIALMHALRRIAPELPIVAATGLAESGSLAQAKTLGVSHFLKKPYTGAALLQIVGAALDDDRGVTSGH